MKNKIKEYMIDGKILTDLEVKDFELEMVEKEISISNDCDLITTAMTHVSSMNTVNVITDDLHDDKASVKLVTTVLETSMIALGASDDNQLSSSLESIDSDPSLALESIVEKSKAVIKKAIEAVKKFLKKIANNIRKLITKVMSFFTKTSDKDSENLKKSKDVKDRVHFSSDVNSKLIKVYNGLIHDASGLNHPLQDHINTNLRTSLSRVNVGLFAIFDYSSQLAQAINRDNTDDIVKNINKNRLDRFSQLNDDETESFMELEKEVNGDDDIMGNSKAFKLFINNSKITFIEFYPSLDVVSRQDVINMRVKNIDVSRSKKYDNLKIKSLNHEDIVEMTSGIEAFLIEFKDKYKDVFIKHGVRISEDHKLVEKRFNEVEDKIEYKGFYKILADVSNIDTTYNKILLSVIINMYKEVINARYFIEESIKLGSKGK